MFDFNEQSIQKELGKIHVSMFENTDEINCPMKSCELMNAGCQQQFEGTTVSLLHDKAQLRWEMIAQMNK